MKYPGFHEIQQTDSKSDMKMQRTETGQDSHGEKQDGRILYWIGLICHKNEQTD